MDNCLDIRQSKAYVKVLREVCRSVLSRTRRRRYCRLNAFHVVDVGDNETRFAVMHQFLKFIFTYTHAIIVQYLEHFKKLLKHFYSVSA